MALCSHVYVLITRRKSSVADLVYAWTPLALLHATISYCSFLWMFNMESLRWVGVAPALLGQVCRVATKQRHSASRSL